MNEEFCALLSQPLFASNGFWEKESTNDCSIEKNPLIKKIKTKIELVEYLAIKTCNLDESLE